MPSVSLCITVKNEAGTIAQLAEDLRAQTLKPDEIVITDGGSSDGTAEMIADHFRGIAQLELIRLPGANIATGRNRAIQQARGEVIALADAGLRFPPTWLRSLVDCLDRDQGADVAFGYVLSRPCNLFETVLGVVTRPDFVEIQPATYPSSAGCMASRRELFEREAFPEWLDFGEDMYLALRWRSRGLRLVHAPGADAGFRPRRNLREFFWQYYHYAEGDGAAGMWPARHLIRFGAYVTGLLLVAIAGRNPLALVPLATGAAWHLRCPYRRLWSRLGRMSNSERAIAVILTPVIRAVGDVAKMLGYVSGLRRAARRPAARR